MLFNLSLSLLFSYSFTKDPDDNENDHLFHRLHNVKKDYNQRGVNINQKKKIYIYIDAVLENFVPCF